MSTGNPSAVSLWPRRWAVLLACCTYPLLIVGQLITTTDAGMAVPDWPGTYGRNLFLYPWQTWLFGPWDLFIEHGHRLFASLVGLVTIGLLVAVCRSGQRRGLVTLSVAALGLVLLQGVLGGVRVLANERLLAMAHGCVGPLFFALTCVLVVLTARSDGASRPSTHRVGPLAALTCGLAYLQLMLGASLRHVDAAVGPWTFAAVVKFHLLMAAVVLVHAVLLTLRTRRLPAESRGLRRLGSLLGGLVVAQVGLGLVTWVVRYGAPRWATIGGLANMEPNVAGGWSQTHLVTAHSAVGSLLVGLLAATAAMAWRSPPAGDPEQPTNVANTPPD